MNRVFAFLVGLAVVGGGIFAVLYVNRGSHVELKGEILKVRSIADGDGAIVFADFPRDQHLGVSVRGQFGRDDHGNPRRRGGQGRRVLQIRRRESHAVFEAAGTQIQRRPFDPGQTPTGRDRRSHGRWPVPISAEISAARKTLHLRIEEVGGVASEIVEKSAAK